jgi:ComF family protein
MSLPSLIRPLDRLLFPPLCRHCGAAFRDGLSNVLCRPCFDAIEPDRDPRCLLCARPLAGAAYEGSVEMRCADCRDRKSLLDRVLCFAPYEGALRLAHHAFKFEGMPSLAPCLAARMVAVLPGDVPPDAVLVPVPSNPDRERERGYPPALLLAREISLPTGLRVEEPLVKIRPTPPQMSLPRRERLSNLKGSFAHREGSSIPGWVVLVDDVTTTGTTLEECARVLRKGGALRVEALVLGRTARDGE